MNHKEALFFIGKCLTIAHESDNKKHVVKTIQSKEVDWDKVVQVSTAHYVFPALYVNLKREDLLTYLPEDLVAYMEHITTLNIDRNQAILQQAKEINQVLQESGITPTFIKGTAFLLQNLYHDIAERMVGDIDFLVKEEDLYPTAEILERIGYKKTYAKLTNPVISKHYPRLYHEEKIAAVEIHKEMVKGSLARQFSYKTCENNFIVHKPYQFLGLEDQLSLTVLAKQHNDDGVFYKTLSLRNSYDIFLLSMKVDFSVFNQKYSFYHNILNPYLALSHNAFNSNEIQYKNTRKARKLVTICLRKLKFPSYGRIHSLFYRTLIYSRKKLSGFLRFFSNKEFRGYYTKRILGS